VAFSALFTADGRTVAVDGDELTEHIVVALAFGKLQRPGQLVGATRDEIDCILLPVAARVVVGRRHQ
jgi:hypothetical protein